MSVSVQIEPSSSTTSMGMDFCLSLPTPILPMFFQNSRGSLFWIFKSSSWLLPFFLLTVFIKIFTLVYKYVTQVFLFLVVASISFSISFAYFIPEFGEIIIPPGLFYFPAYNIVKHLSLSKLRAHFVMNNCDQIVVLIVQF